MNPHAANPIIYIMPDHEQDGKIGGTQRLGKYLCSLQPGSIARKCYMAEEVWQRDRHRLYEFNNDYWETSEKNGMHITGVNALQKGFAEIMESQRASLVLLVCNFSPEF